MKKYLSLITLLFTIFIFSQNDENDNTPVNLKDAKIGYIIDLNNQRKEVYVRLLGNDNKPRVNQRAVRVAEIDKVDPKTNKVDFDRMILIFWLGEIRIRLFACRVDVMAHNRIPSSVLAFPFVIIFFLFFHFPP